jgi:hypothetical protein
MYKGNTVYIQNGVLFSYNSEEQNMPFAENGWNCRLLSKISQIHKNKYGIFSFMCET